MMLCCYRWSLLLVWLHDRCARRVRLPLAHGGCTRQAVVDVWAVRCERGAVHDGTTGPLVVCLALLVVVVVVVAAVAVAVVVCS